MYLILLKTICAKSRFTNAKTPLAVSLSLVKASRNINLLRNINLPFLKVKNFKPTSHRSLTVLATVLSPLTYGENPAGKTPRKPKIGFLSFSDKLCKQLELISRYLKQLPL